MVNESTITFVGTGTTSCGPTQDEDKALKSLLEIIERPTKKSREKIWSYVSVPERSCESLPGTFVENIAVSDHDLIVTSHRKLETQFPQWTSQLDNKGILVIGGEGSKKLLSVSFRSHLLNTSIGKSHDLIRVNPNSTRYRSVSIRTELKRHLGMECQGVAGRASLVIVESADHPICQDLVLDLIRYTRERHNSASEAATRSRTLVLVLFTDSLFFDAQVVLWRLSRSEHHLVNNAHTHMDFRYEINCALRKSNKVEFLYLLGEPRLNLQRTAVHRSTEDSELDSDMESETDQEDLAIDDSSSDDDSRDDISSEGADITSPTADTEGIMKDAEGALVRSPPRRKHIAGGPRILNHVTRQHAESTPTEDEILQDTPPPEETTAKKICALTPTATPVKMANTKRTIVKTVKKTPVKKTPVKKTSATAKSKSVIGNAQQTRSREQLHSVAKQIAEFKRGSIHNVIDTFRQSFEETELAHRVRIKRGKTLLPDLLAYLDPLARPDKQTFNLFPLNLEGFLKLIRETHQDL